MKEIKIFIGGTLLYFIISFLNEYFFLKYIILSLVVLQILLLLLLFEKYYVYSKSRTVVKYKWYLNILHYTLGFVFWIIFIKSKE